MITTHFTFAHRTVLHSGAGTKILVPELVKRLGGKRVVIFTDKGLTNAGITKQIRDLFTTMPGPVELVGVFDEIEQDAKCEIINRCSQFYKECGADSLIALGGGSVLDTVKAVKWMLHKGFTDIRDDLNVGIKQYDWPAVEEISIPHVAIATTAGTGAEVSYAGVIYNEQLKLKTLFIHPYISADIAVLDPELTVGLPPKITAFTGFDALTHAVEGYFSTKANPISDAFANQAVRTIVENLPIAVKQGTNLAARGNMLIGSTLGINALVTAWGEGPVHNIAHAIGAKYGIPHGLANAVLLPSVMEALAPFYLPRIHGFAQALGIMNPPEDSLQSLEEVVQFIRNLQQQVGLPATFAEFNISKKDLKAIIAAVQSDPLAVLYPIPETVITKVINDVFELNSVNV